MVNKEDLSRTKSLGEAIDLLFNRTSVGRDCICTQEAMTGCVAEEYDLLGRSGRQQTYKRLAEDFKNRTVCYGVNHPATRMSIGSILDVGCGSGLLTLELAEQTNGKIIGLDLSEDMLSLAKENLARRSQEKIKEIKKFWEKLAEHCKPSPDDFKKLEAHPPLLDRIDFVKGSVYELEEIDIHDINYVVCRNALHRFQYPEKALKQMYNTLSPNGKMYIRDLRRDADWQIILERIGENRWNTQTLVQDYIGAMASMFTTEELEQILFSLGIEKFNFGSGEYLSTELPAKEGINEYAEETEYVCIITKT